MKIKAKKIISIFLAALMLVGMIPMSVFAGSAGPEVEIISFMRGAQEDYRSSELLEARVTGYDGNVRELTYKWSTTLGTFLYVYNFIYYLLNDFLFYARYSYFTPHYPRVYLPTLFYIIT